ncbi:squalene cyclase [Microbacterium schleiferi]|uniref:Squalene cyclase n=1 Tax=Microbacterium schleiferi TaxID=69362 RepID=A0A7S8RGK7_9MICO|nr:squalene cyclase [Microbacterium schleiferi]QPE04496.1 squalene cyclase [Microbacterium schleiferi]
MNRDELEQWLLDSDPTLRWQVQRDLLGAPEQEWRETRASMAHDGDAARLLAVQDADGQWAGGAYFPAGYTGEGSGQPWTATTWTLTTLREWGLDAAALAGTAEKLRENARWEYDDLPYWDGETDVCINAMTLANGAWLGADVSPIVEFLATKMLPDGGWNCEWVEGSTRSSFHSTINAVRGILAYEQLTGDDTLTDVRHRGEEYLLERRLRYRSSTGEPVGSWADLLMYPYRHPHTALKAVDYFTEAAVHDGIRPDPRIAETIERVRDARQPDGRWLQGEKLEGAVWFPLDVEPGEPSKWVTFLALRVLQRWDAAVSGESAA